MVKIRSLCIAFASIVAVSSMCLLTGMQDAKAYEDVSMEDMMKRIEALEARSGGNVTAPDIRGMKINFDIRHRFEQRTQDFSNTGLTPVRNSTTGQWQYTTSQGGLAERTRKADFEFTLQRVRLSLDADVNKNVRGFINLQDSRTFGAEQSTVGNLGRTDLLEGYIELRNLGDLSPMLSNLELRVGRWQAAYGNHRLIGTLNWANTARSYDGARLRWDNKKNAWIDVFAWQVKETATGGASADDAGSSGVNNQDVLPNLSGTDEVLWGVYSQFKFYEGNVIEPYLIVRSQSRELGQAAGTFNEEQRYTAGFRLDGKNVPGLGGLDYTVEPAWQFGKVEYNPDNTIDSGLNVNRSEPIQAWAIYAGAGYTFKDMPWTPRIGYAYVFASGDEDYGVGAAKTFDHIYPTGHAQLGYMDLAAWQNIEDHQIHFSVKPTKKLVVDAKLHFFSLDEEADSWYSVVGGVGAGVAGGGSIIRRGADTFLNAAGVQEDVDDDLGQEIDITVKYNLFKNFGVVAGYSHFFADDFIEDTGGDLDRGSDWAYLMTTLKF